MLASGGCAPALQPAVAAGDGNPFAHLRGDPHGAATTPAPADRTGAGGSGSVIGARTADSGPTPEGESGGSDTAPASWNGNSPTTPGGANRDSPGKQARSDGGVDPTPANGDSRSGQAPAAGEGSAEPTPESRDGNGGPTPGEDGDGRLTPGGNNGNAGATPGRNESSVGRTPVGENSGSEPTSGGGGTDGGATPGHDGGTDHGGAAECPGDEKGGGRSAPTSGGDGGGNGATDGGPDGSGFSNGPGDSGPDGGGVSDGATDGGPDSGGISNGASDDGPGGEGCEAEEPVALVVSVESEAPPVEVATEIIEAYLGFWDSYWAAASHPVNPRHPGLQRYGAEPMRSRAVAVLRRRAADGLALRRPPDHGAGRVVHIDGWDDERAEVIDCFVDNAVIYEVATGRVRNDEQATVIHLALLRREADGWRVAEVFEESVHNERTSGCTLQTTRATPPARTDPNPPTTEPTPEGATP